VVVDAMPWPAMLAMRWLVAGPILLVIALLVGGKTPDPIGPRQFFATLVLGMLLIGAGNAGLFISEMYISTGLTALLSGTMPIWASLIAAVLNRRGIGWVTTAGFVLGIGGLYILLDPHAGPGANPLGVAAALGGAMVWATGSAFAARLPTPRRPLLSAAMQMLWVAAIYSVVAAFTGDWARAAAVLTHPLHWHFILAVFWLIFMAGLIPFCAYLWLLRNVPLTIANSYAFVNPALAVLLGVMMLGEPFTGRIIIGTIVIIAGVSLIVLRPDRGPPRSG
jgi:drug/metabolite transporter (DMT)-like permease